MSHCAGMTMLRYRSNPFSKTACLQAFLLFGRGRDGLAGLDDVGGEHDRLAAADVAAVVHYAGGHEEHLARLHGLGRLTLDRELECAFDHVAELLARVSVAARLAAGNELGARHDGVAPGHAEGLVL